MLMEYFLVNQSSFFVNNFQVQTPNILVVQKDI